MSRARGELRRRYGPWALVTGAARGLGAAFAEQLGAAGLDLLLVDRDEEALVARCAELRRQHGGIELRSLTVDLAHDDFLERLAPVLDELDVGLLVSNAGISRIAPFLEQDRASLVEQLDVNARATLLLAHALGQRMARRARGGIVILSSAAARAGAARNAGYAATKAYGWNLAESLWAELAPLGIDVLGVAPGPVDTESLRTETPGAPRWMVASAADTAREALDALGRGPIVLTGRVNRLSQCVLGWLPRAWRVRLVSRTLARMSRG